MASQFNLSEPFDYSSGNISENRKLFKQELRLLLIATEKLKKQSEVKTSILLNYIGKQGCKIYNKSEFSSVNDQMDYDIVITNFEEYCILRYKFLTSRQDEAVAERTSYFCLAHKLIWPLWSSHIFTQ